MTRQTNRESPHLQRIWDLCRQAIANYWQAAAFCALLTAVLVAMQYQSGSFHSDLAADPDEPPNVVSSLMVRDYVTQAFPHSPLRFAQQFYAHYPKVAIGHWPPLFHLGEAVWMLLLNRTRTALLLFVAMCAAVLVCSVFLEVRRRTSTAAAMLTAAILVHSRIFHEMLCTVRPDLMMAIFVFWGALYCAEYIRAPSPRSRNLFFGFTLAALLVHQRAGVLLLLPFSLVWLRPARITWKWPVALLMVLSLEPIPSHFNMAMPFSMHHLGMEAWLFVRETRKLTSVEGVCLAVLGLSYVWKENEQRTFWAAMAGLVVCGLIFFLLVPVPWDDRYMIPTLAAMAVLAGGGAQVVIDFLARRNRTAAWALRAAMLAGALVWMGHTTWNIEKKPNPAYRQMIAHCLLCGHDIALIAGDSIHEGDLIAEASLSDGGRSRSVLRASKELSAMSWSGYHYRMLYQTAPEVQAYLDRAHISLVVLQDGYNRPDEDLLRTALETDPREWMEIHPVEEARGVTVYARQPPAQGGHG